MTIVNILGESALRSLVLGLAVAAGLRLLHVQHAHIAKRAWTAVLVLALAMPGLVALHIPSFSFTARWATPRTVIAPVAARASATNLHRFVAPAQPAIQEPAPLLAVPVPAALQGSPAPARSFPWSGIGLVAYVVISALLLLRVFTGMLLAARLWRRAQHFATRETDLPVRITTELRSPVTLGRGILLPLEAITWDNTTLRATLAHEKAHVREGDFYLQLAAALHLCFFWISPLAWWLRPQLARLSETICDRAAIDTTGDGLSYAQLLLRFATAEQTPAGMVAMAQSAGLRERVERLIADPQLANAFRRRRGQAVGAALLLGASAVAAAATVHILQPEAVVLASPQAPAPPAVPAVAAPPAPAPQPEAASVSAPVPEPAAQPLPAPVAAPDPVPVIDPIPPLDAPTAPQDSDSKDDSYAFYDADGSSSTHFITKRWVNDAAKWNAEQRKHPGGAILFRRNGQSYVIDDPALVKQAKGAFVPVEELGKQQGELGEKQGALGEQQGQLGELQGAIGEKQGNWGDLQGKLADKQAQFQLPDGFDSTVNQLMEASVKLAMERDSISDAQRAAFEAQQKEAQANLDKMMADFKAKQPEREAFARQMREQGEQMSKQMEPLMKQMRELGAKQGELGRLQAELGAQQSRLGIQQEKASREADRKLQSIIDQAMRDGKAKPAQ